MNEEKKRADWIFIVILGVCIGALAGFSATPVAGAVIASLIATTTLALSVIGGFVNNTSQSTSESSTPVDIASLAMFALFVLLAIVPASFIRSEIIISYEERETIRALSAPPGYAEIVDSWAKTELNLSREQIAATTYERYANVASVNQNGSANPKTPIPLSSNVSTTLKSSCISLDKCAYATDEDVKTCLRQNFTEALGTGGETFYNIAVTLKDAISEDERAYSVFNIVAAEICTVLE